MLGMIWRLWFHSDCWEWLGSCGFPLNVENGLEAVVSFKYWIWFGDGRFTFIVGNGLEAVVSPSVLGMVWRLWFHSQCWEWFGGCGFILNVGNGLEAVVSL